MLMLCCCDPLFLYEEVPEQVPLLAKKISGSGQGQPLDRHRKLYEVFPLLSGSNRTVSRDELISICLEANKVFDSLDFDSHQLERKLRSLGILKEKLNDHEFVDFILVLLQYQTDRVFENFISFVKSEVMLYSPHEEGPDLFIDAAHIEKMLVQRCLTN